MSSETDVAVGGGKDVFRELPLRYLGYANEVGEAFRNLVPVRLVYLSYLVSSLYVLSHALFRGSVASKCRTKKEFGKLDCHGIEMRNKRTQQLESTPPTLTVIDTLLWQGLASVAIPGLVINRTCALSRVTLNFGLKSKLSGPARGYAVTAIGLAAIPFIIEPIDKSVDMFMDKYMRPLYCKKESGE